MDRGTCSVCGGSLPLRASDGMVRKHGDCPGGGQPPVESVASVGSGLPAGGSDNQASNTPPHAGPAAVYLVRPGRHNEELRYSLRSLANAPIERVVIVGHVPPGITPDAHVPTEQRRGEKAANMLRGLAAAATAGEVPEQFTLFWDDVFVMRPVDRMVPLHRGLLRPLLAQMRKQRGPTGYWKALARAAELLDEDALAYEPAHVPLPVTKTALAAALADHDSPHGIKTIIGNREQLGGREGPNAKNPDPAVWSQATYLSTNDKSFRYGDIGTHIRKRLSQPSRWETP